MQYAQARQSRPKERIWQPCDLKARRQPYFHVDVVNVHYMAYIFINTVNIKTVERTQRQTNRLCKRKCSKQVRPVRNIKHHSGSSWERDDQFLIKRSIFAIIWNSVFTTTLKVCYSLPRASCHVKRLIHS